MRQPTHNLVEFARRSGPIGEPIGAFQPRVRSKFRARVLNVLASNGGGWDHVSVSHPLEIPNWEEMEVVKRMFFAENETAMQLHVPESVHINQHPNCLHLWRPQSQEEIERIKTAWGNEWPEVDKYLTSPGTIPMPPRIFV